eukprot:2914852-Alexandrium_andersonii.AAC.1
MLKPVEGGSITHLVSKDYARNSNVFSQPEQHKWDTWHFKTGANYIMMLVCVLRRSSYWGNPAMHATWEDESLNVVLSKVGSTAHSQVWSRRVLAFFGNCEEHRASKRKR